MECDAYLAGPMRGIPEMNIPAFMKAAELLRSDGFTIWNPAEEMDDPSFHNNMLIDLDALINKCSSVILLPGWRTSVGANAEAMAAYVCGKRALEFVLTPYDMVPYDLLDVDLSKYLLPYLVS